MVNDLKARFHREMLSIYRKAKTECNYNATRFLQMVNEQGGFEAAKSLLHTDEYSVGLTSLWELNRLDLTMEAIVIQNPWTTLFSKEEIEVARKRLIELGYKKV